MAMKSRAFLTTLIFLFIGSLTSLAGAAPGDGNLGLPDFKTVPEMKNFDELDTSRKIEPSELKLATELLLNLNIAWGEISPRILPKITPGLAQSLSRWAHEEMKNFRFRSAIDELDFQARGWTKEDGRLIFESTISELPTHHPLVTRWLKLFLIFDPDEKEIHRIILTIRGQLLE